MDVAVLNLHVITSNIYFSDQYQYLGNRPPTPPLTQQQVRVNFGLGEG